MRVVLVGSPADRATVRAKLGGLGLEVIAEAASSAEARADGFVDDVLLVAPRSRVADVSEPELSQPDVEALTPREGDVLRGLSLGLPNKGIATRLGISDQTVKFHVAAIIGKLGAANRTDAVRRAVRRGLIDL
jgi:DNA-binding NarL/FixJ family response regulator